MRTHTIIALGFAAAATVPGLVRAQDLTVDNRANIKANAEVRAGVKAEVKERVDAMRKDIQLKREDFQKEMEARKLEIKATIDKHRADLKVRLGKIKDERKKEVVERVDGRLGEINGNRTDFFAKAVDQIESVLNKIITRTDEAEKNGKNVATVRTAIEAAKTSIASARTAITAQIGKSYTITITSEANLRAEVKKVRDALHKDVVATQKVVQAAREAVRAAGKALAAVVQVDATTNANVNAQ